MDIEMLQECLSSSSSSSSDDSCMSNSSSDEEDFFQMLSMFKREPLHRVQNFVENVVKNYSEEEFRKNFRLSRSVANTLIEMFKNSTHYKTKLNSGGRMNITAESQCLAFLWFAGNKESYREVSNLFNVSNSTAHTHLIDFLEFLFDISPQYIKFPTTDIEKAEKATEFAELAGFENVIGCIDGCYIYIRKPVHKVRSTYINRHGLISITLQGICDANKNFLDVFVVSPSKIHDSRIYKLSYISKKLPAICGEQYHILGDAAYPLREYLLTPYKDYGNLNAKKNIYNKKHCQTRVKIENSFGLLKQRFRQLIRLDFFSVERMCKFVMGCCVLHNLCIDSGDIWDEETSREPANLGDSLQGTSNQQNENTAESMSEAVLKHLGERKRTRIMDAF